jgi:hypothetical protein
MFIRILVITTLTLCCSIGHAEVAVEIPLSEVWALDMPGTKDVRELEPDAFGEKFWSLPAEEQVDLQKKSLTGQITAQLKWQDGGKPKPGFAVAGTGLQALKAARDVLTEESESPSSLSAKTEITAVFSSIQSGSHVRIYEVKRKNNIIEVWYRFEPHDAAYSSIHFALIPLGKLTSGTYHVKFVNGPMEEKYLSAGFRPKTAEAIARIIDDSLLFSIK